MAVFHEVTDSCHRLCLIPYQVVQEILQFGFILCRVNKICEFFYSFMVKFMFVYAFFDEFRLICCLAR